MNEVWLSVLLAGLILILSILIALLTPKALSIITYPFSFKTFGIRKIKRRHAVTDTFGNVCLCIALIYCLLYPFLPYNRYITIFLMTFSYLCTLSRVPRMSEVYKRRDKSLCAFFISAIFGYGLCGSLGLFNNQQLLDLAENFVAAVQDGQWKNVLFYLNNAAFMGYLCQGLLMAIVFYALWSQFKWMRVENIYKARNIFFYVCKMTVYLILILALSVFGGIGLSIIYQIEENQAILEQTAQAAVS